MSMGLKVFDRSNTLTFDSTALTWTLVAALDIGSGASSQTVTYDGSSLPPGMELKVALQIIDNLPLSQKQLVPTVTVVNTNDASRSVTVTTQTGTSTNSEGESVPAYSAACKILILGR